MEELRRRRASAADASKRVTRELATVRRNSERRSPLTRRAAHVIWILFSLLADPSAAILVFLNSANDRNVLEEAERSFMSSDMADILAVCDVSNPSDVAATRIARRLHAEHQLFLWCRALNFQGITPSTRALLREAMKYADVLPARTRVWAQRWRARWGARLGKFGVAECSSEDLRGKVCK